MAVSHFIFFISSSKIECKRAEPRQGGGGGNRGGRMGGGYGGDQNWGGMGDGSNWNQYGYGGQQGGYGGGYGYQQGYDQSWGQQGGGYGQVVNLSNVKPVLPVYTYIEMFIYKMN